MEAISIIVIVLCVISAIQRRKYRSETAKMHPRYEWVYDTKKDECLDCKNAPPLTPTQKAIWAKLVELYIEIGKLPPDFLKDEQS